MANTSCPTCGHTIRVSRPRVTRTDTAAIERALLVMAAMDTSSMNDRDVHAHYRAIAPLMDVRAFLASTLSPSLRSAAEDLYQQILAQKGKHTPASVRAYRALHASWRTERNTADRSRLTIAA